MRTVFLTLQNSDLLVRSGSFFMPLAVAEQPLDTEAIVQPVGRSMGANEYLDPLGELQQNARDIAANRLRHAGREPRADVLGAARLLLAAEMGRSGTEVLSQLNANLDEELRKEIIEAIKPSRQLTVNWVRVDQEGRANVGGVELVPMFARGIHPGNKGWYNRLSELNVTEELLCEQHFKDPGLRDAYSLVYICPVPSDEEPRHRQLFKYGFRPDTGKWKIRSHSYVNMGGVWWRTTQELSMGGSDVGLFRELYKELGIELPSDPNRVRRLGALALRKMRVPRMWRAYDAPSTQVLATPMLASKATFPNGAVDVARVSDVLQAQRSGRWAFCGDVTEEAPERADYDLLAADSAILESEINNQIKRLAAVAKAIVRSGASFEVQSQRFNNEKIDLLRELSAQRPEFALHAFGPEAHGLYKQVSELRSQSRHEEAEAVLKQAHEKSQQVVTCGFIVSAHQVTLEDFRDFPDLYLIAKYGVTEAVKVGRCVLCGRHGWVGRCGPGGSGFCGGCDSKDTNKDGSSNGYIASVMRSRARLAARNRALEAIIKRVNR